MSVRAWQATLSCFLALTAVFLCVFLVPSRKPVVAVAAENHATPFDPAAWGDDHVGKPLPEYVESGECLFCHRADVGTTWAKNRHNRTIRDAEADQPAVQALRADATLQRVAGDVELVLGHERHNRFLKRSEDYGKLDLLSVGASRGRGGRWRLSPHEAVHWDTETFARSCAGCHATAVDPEAHTFSAVSLDCFTCHGDAPVEHANEPELMPLAKARNDPPRVVTSICASCHIRFGRSKSTGLPYPNNFVAGDNLFRDFQVDFSLADDESINPGDRHVLANVRDVVLLGREEMTCLSCHDVHTSSTARHRDLADRQYCQICHEPGQSKKLHHTYEVHSELCEY